MLGQLLLHMLGIRSGLVDLVDRDDDGHARRLGMVDGLDGLWHDAVVCGDDEDRDVRNLCAARAHGSERLMAGRIEEDNLLPLAHDLIRTNMLCDAARLVRRDGCLANGIEERRLAVVDMSHDGYDRRTNDERLGIILDLGNLRWIRLGRQFLTSDAEFDGDERRRLIVDFLVDRRHDAHEHELLDDFGRRIAHLARKILDGNALANLDVRRMGDLHFGSLLLLALVVAAAIVLVAKLAAIVGAAAIIPTARIIRIASTCGIAAAISIAALCIVVALVGIAAALVLRRPLRCVGAV